jgi:pilus assembly protein CpaB
MGRLLTAALIAMGLAGLGLVAWVSLRDNGPVPVEAQAAAPAPATPVAQRVVLVAAGPLRAGNLIKPADLDEKSMPADQVPAGASASTPQTRSQLFGAMIRHSLGQGEVILPDAVMRAGDHGFLAAVLQPGMRAMTLGAESLTSDLDLVFPGDHVDVILIQQADAAGVAAARRVFGNTVLSDVRVLAVDQQMLDGAAADKAIPKGARTVTVEVTGDQATRLAVAMHLGKLSLSVRASDRTKTVADTAGPAGTTWAGDVAPGLSKGSAPVQNHTVRLFSGTADGKEYQF